MMDTSATERQGADLEIFPAESQGKGAFDGGRITEIKPIPFPQESGGSRRLGPLLYWAWASARKSSEEPGGAQSSPTAMIGMHPHKGFEIMSYVLEGEIGHTDTAGNNRRVGSGGAQVMRTGSGVSHQEEMYGDRTEFFQIWFEPDLQMALKEPAAYADFSDEDFPVTESGAVTVKSIIGNGGPVEIAAPVLVEDVSLGAGAVHSMELSPHHALAAVVVTGAGRIGFESRGREVAKPDFAVIKSGAEENLKVEFEAGDDGGRLVVVRVPLVVPYRLMG